MATIQAGAEPRTALPGGRGVRRSELTIITIISELSCCAIGSNVLVLNRSASNVRSGDIPRRRESGNPPKVMRLQLESGACAIATRGRGRGMADGTVRKIVHDRTDRHDRDFGGTAVATHFRHSDISNPDMSLGHKAIPHNRRRASSSDSQAARQTTGGFRSLSLELHRRWPSPQCASFDRTWSALLMVLRRL
jgi:hypothetical protein